MAISGTQYWIRLALRWVTVLAVVLGAYAIAIEVDWHWLTPTSVMASLDGAANWGPVIVILAMAAAVVVSPVPSAPIAIAAGAAYGHLWGTAFALIGAEIGALIAFEIARRWGRERVARRVAGWALPNALNSQVSLALFVFASRLLPAISFDIVSYAAGLTQMKRRWFALATAFGMVPATFLLSHAGAGISAADDGIFDVLVTIGGLGLLAVLGLLYGVWRRATQRSGLPENRGRKLG